MIQIKTNQGKWRITIQTEEWEFPNQSDFKSTLDMLLSAKEKYGKLRENKDGN